MFGNTGAETIQPADYANWNALIYNDQNWASGQGGISCGDNDDNATIA